MTKLTRPDVASMILAALCVVGIVALAYVHTPVPDVLTFVAMGALGIGGGTALNGSASVDTAAQRVTASLAALEELVSEFRTLHTPAHPVSGLIPAPAAPAAAAGVSL